MNKILQKRSLLLAGLGLAFLAYILFFHRLGGIGLVGPDEPRYAQISREMVESGDYITPRLMGEPWFEKPVLFYWGAALAYKIFGISEWAARLTSALSGLLGVILIFSLGSKYISKNGGFIASAILISSPLYFSLARAVSMDMLLTACITGAWGCLYFSLFQERRAVEPAGWQRWVNPQLGIYFFLGLSVLAKGPVGIALVGGSFCLYLLLTHQWNLLKRLRLFPGLLVFLLIVFPWYWLCYRNNGFVFIEQFLIQHNLERFTTDRYQHSQPLWFYGAVLGVGFLPWIFHLPGAIRRSWRNWKTVCQTGEQKDLFLWLWIMVPLLFFSFSRSKLPGYILPVIPPLSLLIAREYSFFKDNGTDGHGNRWFLISSYLQCGFISFLAVFLPVSRISSRWEVEPRQFFFLSTVLMMVGLLGFYFTFQRRVGGLLVCSWAGLISIVLYLSLAVFPLADRMESQRAFAQFLKAESGLENPSVYLFYLSRRVEFGLDFYLNRKTRMIYSLKELDQEKGKEVYLIAARTANLVLPDSKFRLLSQQIWDDKRILKIAVRSDDSKDE